MIRWKISCCAVLCVIVSSCGYPRDASGDQVSTAAIAVDQTDVASSTETGSADESLKTEIKSEPKKKPVKFFDMSQLADIDGFRLLERDEAEDNVYQRRYVDPLSIRSIDNSLSYFQGYLFGWYFNYQNDASPAWKSIDACVKREFSLEKPDDRESVRVSLPDGQDWYYKSEGLNLSAPMDEVIIPKQDLTKLRAAMNEQRITFVESRSFDNQIQFIHSEALVPRASSREATFKSIAESLNLNKLRGSDAYEPDDISTGYFDFTVHQGVTYKIYVSVMMTDGLPAKMNATSNEIEKYRSDYANADWFSKVPHQVVEVLTKLWTLEAGQAVDQPQTAVKVTMRAFPLSRWDSDKLRTKLMDAEDDDWTEYGDNTLRAFPSRTTMLMFDDDYGLPNKQRYFLDTRSESPYYLEAANLVCDAMSNYRQVQKDNQTSPF